MNIAANNSMNSDWEKLRRFAMQLFPAGYAERSAPFDEMIRFQDHKNFVEIDIANQEDGDLPSRGDAYFTIEISSNGFSGHNNLWVSYGSLSSFCKNLIRLEEVRKGETILESISPEKLYLKVFSTNSRGHMGILGTTGYIIQNENSQFNHSVSFGFEFDPSQLVAAIKVDWVKRNGSELV